MQLVAVTLVSMSMAPSLAHALELPGKLRLSEEQYRLIQPIYYPGFTIGGGIGEGLGLLATGALLFIAPYGSADFWLAAVAFGCMTGVQVVFWVS
jgi:hypothetical protein